MRPMRTAALVTMVCGSLALGAVPLGAATAGSSTAGSNTSKFCDGLSSAGAGEFNPDSGDSVDVANAKAIAKDYRRLAKKAPSKRMKKDLKILANWTVRAAETDADDFTELLSGGLYSKVLPASLRVSTFLLTDCLGDALGDLEDLDLGDLGR